MHLLVIPVLCNYFLEDITKGITDPDTHSLRTHPKRS